MSRQASNIPPSKAAHGWWEVKENKKIKWPTFTSGFKPEKRGRNTFEKSFNRWKEKDFCDIKILGLFYEKSDSQMNLSIL